MNDMQMEFFIYFSNESVAQEAQERIEADYPESIIQIRPAEENSKYLCTITMDVDRSTIQPVTALDEYFENIASEYRGDYDGSGTVLE